MTIRNVNFITPSYEVVVWYDVDSNCTGWDIYYKRNGIYAGELTGFAVPYKDDGETVDIESLEEIINSNL